MEKNSNVAFSWLRITNLARVFIILAFLLCFVGTNFAQKHYKELKYPKLKNIKIPEVEQVTLENGMQLFLLEDHELPLINMRAMTRVGSIYEPEDKVGLAAITGEVMRTGGTISKTGDELDEELESLAASVETGIGMKSGYAYMSVLKKDIDTGLSILADVLMNPAFREEKIQLAKVQHRSSISRRNDEVEEIASREFYKLIYGEDSVYARHTEYATIDNITREDLVNFHKKYYHPNNMMLGVWGDFDTQEIIQKVESAFKEWEKAEIDFPDVPEVKYEFRPTVNLIRKEDVNQTTIYMGHIGGMRSAPDYFELFITVNRILGGSYTSRLFKNVRSRQGLAYSVYGVYQPNYDFPGVIFVVCQTKSENTVKAIRAIKEEIENITQSEVTDEELSLAKENFLNSFVFNFDTKGEIVERLMRLAFFDYPLDFLQKAKERIEGMTKDDVLRVAQKYLHPDKMQILAVGKPEEFDESLSVFGQVNEIDISIPVPKEEVPEATADESTKGKKLFDKALAACGGAQKFAQIENFVINTQIAINTAQGEMKVDSVTTFVIPDKLHQVLNLPMGQMKQIISGDKAWAVTPQGTVDIPESQRKDMQASIFRDWINLFHITESEELNVQYLETGEFDDTKVEIILVSDGKGNSVKLFLDANSFVPIKQEYKGMDMTGPAEMEEIYSDFREVNGIKFPFNVLVRSDGKKYLESKVTEIKFNTEIDSSIFEKQ